MKKTCTLFMIVCLYLPIIACGKSTAAKQADEAIAAIGEVTLESEEAIATAEKLYGILTESEKSTVDNRLALAEAREKYDKLAADKEAEETEAQAQAELAAKKEQEEEQLKAELAAKKEQEKEQISEVENAITAIGIVTLDSEDSIIKARNAYDALDEYLKKEVSNYNDLTEAEHRYIEIMAEENAKKEAEETVSLEKYEYYEECPILPRLDSVLGLFQSSKNTFKTNGVYTSITYRYTGTVDDLKAYAEVLEKCGFTCEQALETEYVISVDGMRIAVIDFESGQVIVDISPEATGISSIPEAQTAAIETELSIGEEVSTERNDFTLNNVELTFEMKPDNTSGVYTSYPAEDGKVYIHIDAIFTNKTQKDLRIRDLPAPKAHYKEAFTYNGFVVVDDGDNSFTWGSSQIVCIPLASCHYHGLIECPEEVYDSTEPLYVTIKLADNATYRYTIR